MSVYDALPLEPPGTNAHRGTFSRDVASLTTMAYVYLTDFSPIVEWGPCRWQARGATLPAEGDGCLVIFDNTDEPWVVAWWPE